MLRTSFQDIKVEVRRRIATRQWKPGDLIPNEEDIAQEFGCSRATVNRALRELAELGLLDRRRKAGTRVVVNPVGKATLAIPIIREEIEDLGLQYEYRLIERQISALPAAIAAAWNMSSRPAMLRLKSLHLAGSKPFAIEDRWINTDFVPAALDADFFCMNSNEWLVQTAPYSHGHTRISAATASQFDCRHLELPEGSPLLMMERETWYEDAPVTHVTLSYVPGHSIHMR